MHRSKTVSLLGVWLVSAMLLGSAFISSTNMVGAQDAGRYYPETDKTLAPEFISYYDSHGGLPIFGYPLTDTETEGGFKVQYLERARLEYHPEHAGTPYEVQLGLLGNIITAGRQFAAADVGARLSTADRQYFPET